MSGLMTSVLVLPSSSVWPSGSDSATARAPIVPPAPGRLSMTTLCPRIALTRCPIRRARTSAGPPGAKPTTSRMGFVGKACADAVPLAAQATQAPSAIERRSVRLLSMAVAPEPPRLFRKHGVVEIAPDVALGLARQLLALDHDVDHRAHHIQVRLAVTGIGILVLDYHSGRGRGADPRRELGPLGKKLLGLGGVGGIVEPAHAGEPCPGETLCGG